MTKNPTDQRIIIAGGSLGGLRSAEALRRQGWTGHITIIGEEPHYPYTRPPLSKRLLQVEGTVDDVLLARSELTDDVEWRLGTRVVASDLSNQTVTLENGEVLSYDGLIAATGVRSRRFPHADPAGNRQAIRTVDEAMALSTKLGPGVSVVIIGAGFIGCEVASVALKRECDVHLVAVDRFPMQIPLGELAGEALQDRHEASGFVFHLNRGVDRFGDDGSVFLDDGTRLEADIIIEAIGTIPNTDWLDGNGLDLSNGVVTDERMSIVGAKNAVAVGDVARFPHLGFGPEPRRIEHFHVPADSAVIAAASLLRDLGFAQELPDPFLTVPSFWSQQGSVSIRSFGSIFPTDRVDVLEGDLSGDCALGYYRDDVLTGVVLFGLPREAGKYLNLVKDSMREPRLDQLT